MRDVLVVLFWLWVLVALGVYGFRIWRRFAKGPKATREATMPQGDAVAPGDRDRGRGIAGRLGLSGAPLPPLPAGPVEARLPRSLRDGPAPPSPRSPVGTASSGASSADESYGAGVQPVEAHLDPALAPNTPVAPVAPPTVAEALAGIQMPEQLLPVVDADDLARRDDRRARFSGTGTTVRQVAAALADELERLGYSVDGLTTATADRAGLSAQRDGVAVAATVHLDPDTAAVIVELSV